MHQLLLLLLLVVHENFHVGAEPASSTVKHLAFIVEAFGVDRIMSVSKQFLSVLHAVAVGRLHELRHTTDQLGLVFGTGGALMAQAARFRRRLRLLLQVGSEEECV